MPILQLSEISLDSSVAFGDAEALTKLLLSDLVGMEGEEEESWCPNWLQRVDWLCESNPWGTQAVGSWWVYLPR